MKINVKDTPRGMVDNAGTYHGTAGKAGGKYPRHEYRLLQFVMHLPPVHPSQNIPMTRHGPAIIAPGSLSSGGGVPCHLLTSSE